MVSSSKPSAVQYVSGVVRHSVPLLTHTGIDILGGLQGTMDVIENGGGPSGSVGSPGCGG